MVSSKRGRSAIGRVSVLAVATVLVAGCGENIRKELGLVGNAPDEFTVIKRKPLTMPEDIDAAAADLPRPQPNAPNLVDPRPVEDARTALLGDVGGEREELSDAEVALLAAAGVAEADDAIRDELAEPAQAGPARQLLENVLGLPPREEVQALLDPVAEAKRLALEARASKNPDLEVPEQAEP